MRRCEFWQLLGKRPKTLDHVIRKDVDLAACFIPTSIYSSAAPASPSFSLTVTESKARLAAFASGSVNLLIATVVAEEGMDVPEANCVIRFDPMINSVSFVQGRGRARQAQSSFVVLSEREDRPTSTLAAIESQQLQIVRDFQPLPVLEDSSREKEARRSRERNAREVLIEAANSSPLEALAALNLFCKKTKVELQEDVMQTDGSKGFIPFATALYSVVLGQLDVQRPPKLLMRRKAQRGVQQ